MVDFLKHDRCWWFFVSSGAGCLFLPYLMVKYFEGGAGASGLLEAFFLIATPPFGVFMLIIGAMKAYSHFTTKASA